MWLLPVLLLAQAWAASSDNVKAVGQSGGSILMAPSEQVASSVMQAAKGKFSPQVNTPGLLQPVQETGTSSSTGQTATSMSETVQQVLSDAVLSSKAKAVGDQTLHGEGNWLLTMLDGKQFYVSDATGESTWDVPAKLPEGAKLQISTGVVLPDPVKEKLESIVAKNNEMEVRPYYSRAGYGQGAQGAAANGHPGDCTLLYQSDFKRAKSRLEAVTSQWAGPVSAAILVSDQDEIIELDGLISQSPLIQRHVDVHLCIAPRKWTHYPINKMRNQAMHNSRTDWVFVIDADEDPVADMTQYMNEVSNAIAKLSAAPTKTIFAVTSFQWGPQKHSSMPRNRRELSDSLRDNRVELKALGYHQAYTPPGMSIDQWLKMDEAERLDFRDHYEPYFIALKGGVGDFDERFVGWGGNYATHTLKLALQGAQYVMLPRLFTFTDEQGGQEHKPPLDPSLTNSVSNELGTQLLGCTDCGYDDCFQKCGQKVVR